MTYRMNTYVVVIFALSALTFVDGEEYQFYLDILDMLDSEWVYEPREDVGTRIQCASLCFQDQSRCFYFGYMNETCYLLKNNVDRNRCSQDDNCTFTGMKVYKRVTGELEATTEEPFTCEPPEGAEARVNCEMPSFLLRAMGSRSPFFGDVLGATCTDMKEQVYKDEEEVLIFFSLDGGITLNSQCPDEHHVIVEYKLCAKRINNIAVIPAITLHCRFLKDKDRMEKDLYNVTSDPYNQLVDCGEAAAIQKIFITKSDNPGTKVIYTCVKVKVEDGPLPVGV